MNRCETRRCSIIIQKQCGDPICFRCTVTASVAKVLSDWQHGGIKIKQTAEIAGETDQTRAACQPGT